MRGWKSESCTTAATPSGPRSGVTGNAVVKRRRFPAAAWSSVWYMLASFAVITYTHHWIYVIFAAAGSFIGAYVTMTFLHPGPVYPPPPVGSAAA